MIDEMIYRYIPVIKNRAWKREQHSKDKNQQTKPVLSIWRTQANVFSFVSIVKQEIILKSTDVLLIVLVICQF